MDQQTFSWVHPAFNAGNAGDCRFYAVAGNSGMSYAVLGKGNHLMALKAWDFTMAGAESGKTDAAIRSVLATDEPYQYDYEVRQCALDPLHTTLVPKRFFQEDTVSTYFHLLLQDKPYVYGATRLSIDDLWSVFAVESELYPLFMQFFGNAAFSHLLAPLSVAYRSIPDQERSGVYIHVRGYRLLIIVLDRGHLLFSNSFLFDSPGDFLYYVLLAYEQCRLKVDMAPLYISGSMLENGAIYRNLYRYIQHIRFLELPGAVQLPSSFSLPNKHLFYDLFAVVAAPVID